MPSLDQSELITAYIEAYNRFDVEAMMAALHEAVQFRHVQKGETVLSVEGRDALRRLAEDSAGAFAERRQTVKDIRDDGDTVIVELDFMARLHDGPRVDGQGRSVFTFRDGLIGSITDEAD